MKYWFVHMMLIGLLVTIWVPAMVEPNYKFTEAYERQTESVPVDTTVDYVYLPPVPESEPMNMPSGSAAPEKSSIISTIVNNLKELGSLVIMFGNILTFFWQWKDRKENRSSSS